MWFPQKISVEKHSYELLMFPSVDNVPRTREISAREKPFPKASVAREIQLPSNCLTKVQDILLGTEVEDEGGWS